MTVSAQTPIKRSTANGVTTVFPYDFKILAAADLEVSLDGVVKTLTTDYTLSGVGDDAGGNVTMLSAPANGAIVVRRRNMAYTREVDYQDQGELPTDTLDDDQDAPILMIQQVAEGLSRAVSLPPESTGVSLTLPTPAALQCLRWNAAADALESVLLADVSLISLTAYAQTLLNAVDAAAARLVLGITTFGSSLVTAANSAAARTAMGAAASGAATASGLTLATSRLLGRTTADTGAVEELSLGRGLVMASGVLQTVDSSLQLNTANGYGSTNVCIRLFANIAEQRGSYATDYTVSNSATLGSSITINTSDWYTLSYSESVSGFQYFGISINSSQLSTQLLNINLADRLTGGACENTGGGGFCGGRFYLPAGSVIRPHSNAVGGGTTAFCQLRISRG